MLLEAGWDACCDEVWACSVSAEEQLRRVMARDGIDEPAANQRLETQARGQIAPEARSSRVHVLLSTEGNPLPLETHDGDDTGGGTGSGARGEVVLQALDLRRVARRHVA